MKIFVERLIFPWVLVCFLLSFGWGDSLYAEESLAASFYNGGGEVNLVWDQTLFATGTLVFAEVDVDAEIWAGGAAIADAAAESLLDPNDSGEVRTAVVLDGIISGALALAHSTAKAHNMFVLQNTSDERVNVNFNWSAAWFVSGEIDQPETNRSEMGIQLTLAKSRLVSGSDRTVDAVARMLKNQMKSMGTSWRDVMPRHREFFSKYVAVRLPEEALTDELSGDEGKQFMLTFAPKQTYLFALTAEARGLVSASVEGCSSEFWRRHIRDWPIDPRTKFADVFGIGPENLSIWVALIMPQHRVSEPRLFRNAVAALLNAESPEIAYYSDNVDTLAELVKSTFESGNSDELQALADDFEFYNNVGASDVCASSLL